jgi:acyl-homoserine-lactone acylase
LFNPPTGFVQNSNDVPWTCTYPTVLNPKNYPAYIAPEGWYARDFRDQHAINMVKNNHSVTFDDLVGYKLNTELETADRYLDSLLKAVAEHPDTTVLKAAKVLRAWDRHADAGSRGTILWIQWCNDMHPDSVYKNPWELANPATTPNGLKYPEYAVRKLKQAANEVIKRFGSLDPAWGDFNRFRSGNIDLPGNGAPSTYGSYRAIGFRYDYKDKKFRAVVGDSYVAVTEFGKPVKAMVSLSYGNASQTGSKHIGDQLKLMSEKRLRPALLTRVDILKNLEEKEVLDFK